MGFRKYMKVEETTVPTPERQQAAGEELRKQGHSSAQGLNPAELQSLNDKLDARD